MKAIVHLGMPKTGSTAIQATLAIQREHLRQHGFVYPQTLGKEGPQYAFMVRAIVLDSSPERARKVAPKFRYQQTRELASDDTFEERLSAEIEGADTMIVSSESFWNQPDVAQPVGRYLARFADEVTLIVYLRRQDLHLASWHGQSTKGNWRDRAPDLSPMAPSPPQYQFHDRLAEWRASVPHARIIARPYERSELVGGDVIADFAHHAGLPLDLEARGGRTNPSLDAVAVSFLMRLNARLQRPQGEGRHRGRQLVQRTLAARAEASAAGSEPPPGAPGHGLPSERVSLSREQALAYLERFADQNAAVAREYLGREDGVLFREPVKGPERDTLDVLANDENALDHAMDLVALVTERTGEELTALDATIAGLRRKVREAVEHTKRLAAANAALREQNARLREQNAQLRDA